MNREGTTAQRIQNDLHIKFSLIVQISMFPIKGHSGMSMGGGEN